MISIGLPAVKSHFLSGAIYSLLNQSYTDFEVIIVNDRKDSGIRSIISGFTDPRIKYYEEEKILPIVQNWNRVLSYANGEYFILFSDDDIYHPDFLAEMISLQSLYQQCDVFHCRVKQINETGEELSLTPLCPEFETGLEFLLERLKGNRIQFAPDFMARTGKLRAIGGFTDLPLAWGSDDLTWFQLALNNGIAYSPKPLVSWRKSESQVSRSGDLTARLDAVDQYREWIRDFISSYIPLNDRDHQIISELKSYYARSIENQKLYLVAMSSATGNYQQHINFFLENRKKYELKITWLIYSLYTKLFGKKVV
jgi:glycosyltransferase involved in cell wall biosynthesis